MLQKNLDQKTDFYINGVWQAPLEAKTIEVINPATEKPYAVILSCLDSRIPPEVVFDQGIGEVFVARVAGNIENDDILGSLEFGTAAMGAKLIVVMGHTKCGAIKGACQNVKLGHLTALLDKIQPAVAQVKSTNPKFNPQSYEDIDHVSVANVMMTVENIRKKSQVIRDLEAQNKIRIVGAMYDISSGKVTFYDKQDAKPGMAQN